MLPVLVTCLDSPRHRDWGLEPERIPAPFLALPNRVTIPEALAAGLAAFPGARKVAYIQPEFLYQFFNFLPLYEGKLHRWLDASSHDPLRFRRIDHREAAEIVCVTADSLPSVDPTGPSTDLGEIELELLRDDPRPKTLVFGDSHVWFLYTAQELIGMRGVVVDVVNAGGDERLKISRHIGAVTMHRLATRGEITPEFFRRYGLRPGDRVVAVCGEIDVRNHVGRIAAERGIPVARVIRDLCARWSATLARAVREFGPLEVVLSCPTPPLDFERLEPSNRVEHWGTIDERIAATREMSQWLAYEAEKRGWRVLDLYDAFADARGAMDFERSDRFCHVAHAHKGPAISALRDLMLRRAEPAPPPMPRASDYTPEFEFLASLSRIAPKSEDEARALELAEQGLDWPRVARLAVHHGVSPLVDRTLSHLDVPEMPPGVRAELHQQHVVSVRHDLARYHQWRSLCRAFEEWGIPALSLKGFPVVLSTYGQVGLRPVGDLDFLVHRDDVARTLSLLEEHGFPLWPHWQAALRNVGLPYLVKHGPEIGCVSARGIEVDLHWELGPREFTMPARELMASAVTLRVDEQTMLVPPPDLHMVFLLLHGQKSAWGRLRWAVDVAEGLDRMTAGEYASVVRRLAAARQRHVLANALQLIQELWGRLPTVCSGARDERAVQPRFVQYCRATMERDRDWAVVWDRWRVPRMLRDRIGRWPSLRTALAHAARPNFFDWSYVALPPGLRLGYYAVRPYRLLREAIGGRRPRRNPPPRLAGAAGGPQTPLTFVTAIYRHGANELLGGRGFGLAHYLPTLINIANLGAPIVVFCPPSEVGAISAAIAPYFRDYRVVPFELSSFEYFDEVMEWKRTYLKELHVNNRNEVLCFLKSYWLQQAIRDNPFGHDQFFWIDAGLFHHGIVPERLGGVELLLSHPASRYYPENRDNICTPDLGRRLAGAVPEGKVFFCALPYQESRERRERYEEVAAARYGLPRDGVRIVDHLVGGLFGGRAEDVTRLHHRYADLLRLFIETRSYTLEEQIFSTVHAVFPELFHVERFGTWYFHSPGERTSYLTEEGDSFYKIFLRIGRTAPSGPA